MSRQVEAFLEMMAVERGASANTLDAYRRDLDDLDSFLSRRNTDAAKAAAADLAAYMRALDWRPAPRRGGCHACGSSTASSMPRAGAATIPLLASILPAWAACCPRCCRSRRWTAC